MFSLQPGLSSEIADTVREPLLVLDERWCVLAANRAYYATFATMPAETCGRSVYELGNGYWDVPELRETLGAVLTGSASCEDMELEREFGALGHRVMLLNAREVPGGEAGARIVLLAIDDITRRREVEEALAAQAVELERSNRELEHFATVASHDLQEPLRKIRTYSDLLARHLPDLDSTGSDYLSRIGNAAARMQALIGDVLALSRVMAKPRPFEPTDLGRIVTDVLADLEVGMGQADAVVEADPLPVIDADPMQMRQLFQNVLSNALKFRRPGTPVRIRISHKRAGDSHCLRIADNGIGFDASYASLIFEPFQRLNPRGDYAGSGIGLAIAQRIVERHRGRISAEGVAGKGAVITLVLPVRRAPGAGDSRESERA